MARAAPAEGAGEAHSVVSTDSVGVLRREGEGEEERETELVQLHVDEHVRGENSTARTGRRAGTKA